MKINQKSLRQTKTSTSTAIRFEKDKAFLSFKTQLQPLPRTGAVTCRVRSKIDGASLTFFRFGDRLEILSRFSDERIDGRNVAIRQNSDGSAGRKEPDERAEPAQVPGMRHAQN